MTHNELLAKIEQRYWKMFNHNSQDQTEAGIEHRTLIQNQYFVLRAVVELHKPMKEPKKSGWFEGEEYKEGYVIGCEFDNYHYPCPTIQAIEKELR